MSENPTVGSVTFSPAAQSPVPAFDPTNNRFYREAESKALVQAAPEISEMFSTLAAFETGQRMAVALAKCDLLPKQYHNSPANCMVLISIAHRFRHLGVDPFMVAQQLVAVNGKYGWQGQFVMALVNGSKRFSTDLQYLFDGKDDDYGCTAFVMDREGKRLEGTKITWKMVKGEGWLQKSGSKWQTMPEQMFRYRAAAFFGRAYTPDLLMGFHTADELEDIGMKDVSPPKGDALTSLVMGDVPKNVARETAVESSPSAEGEKGNTGGFTQPAGPANPTPAFFDDRPKKSYPSDFGKLKPSLVDDVSA